MSPKQWPSLLATIAAFAALPYMPSALAGQPPDVRANPVHPDAVVPMLRYESVFDNYRTSAGESDPARAWRPANDEMGKLGGHAGHMKEASVPQEANDAVHAKHH
ncbi:hypothetical protein [Noviherbaspirillum sp.]|uniref:hypothetical protein n=1 Tax=Noviherbaspirillum sp. TaxID=1926288 RepID=UPI002FE40A11